MAPTGDLRVLVCTNSDNEFARNVHSGSVEDICEAISCLTHEMEKRAERVVKILVHTVYLRERLVAKPLFVTNMCGKILHMSSKHVHSPSAKPYVTREFNNFGVTESVYTKICNFHSGIQNATTLMRAGTRSKDIQNIVSHIFVVDNISIAVVHNIVYSARLGRPVCSKNSEVGRAIQKACGCPVVTCLQIEESMFVHSFHVQVPKNTSLPVTQFPEGVQISVRINICRTGVVNFFVGIPGGISLDLEPEILTMPVCSALLDAILSAT
jgi:hypothetical protein